jgi:hypothetical protein
MDYGLDHSELELDKVNDETDELAPPGSGPRG